MQLTNDQMKAVKNGDAVRFHDEETDFVIVRADVYERLQGLVCDDSPWTDEEMDLLAAEDADYLGWDGMDPYQELEQ